MKRTFVFKVWSIFVSVCLHLLLVTLPLYFKVSDPIQPIEIESMPPPIGFRLRDFLVTDGDYQVARDEIKKNGTLGVFGPEFGEGDPNLSWGYAWGAQGIRRLGILSKLYEIIDSQLSYPQEIAVRKFEGTVTVVLAFDSNGEYDHKQSKFSSTSNFLKVYIARIIRQTLRDRKEWVAPVKHSPLKVKCRFIFEYKNHLVLVQSTEVLGNRHWLNGGNERVSVPGTVEKYQFLTGKYLTFYRYHNPISFLAIQTIRNDQTNVNRTVGGVDILPLLSKGFLGFKKLLGLVYVPDPLDKYRTDPDWDR